MEPWLIGADRYFPEIYDLNVFLHILECINELLMKLVTEVKTKIKNHIIIGFLSA